MQEGFYRIADQLAMLINSPEVSTFNYAGEVSDFVRLNNSKIRQPGHVIQRVISLDLTNGKKHTSGQVACTGDFDSDIERTTALLESLRNRLPHLPEDPHHLYSTEVHSSERHQENQLPKAHDAIESILVAGQDRDLVGIYASGGVHRGFANSLGQKNWFSSYSFNLDWNFYHEKEKVVKAP